MSISASNDTGPVICSAVCVSLEQDEMSVCLRSEIINLLLSYACDEIPLTRGSGHNPASSAAPHKLWGWRGMQAAPKNVIPFFTKHLCDMQATCTVIFLAKLNKTANFFVCRFCQL